MSKLGTKNAVIATDPVHYLVNFGEEDTLKEKDAELAEKNMVRVLARARSTQQLRHLMTSGLKSTPEEVLELMLSLP